MTTTLQVTYELVVRGIREIKINNYIYMFFLNFGEFPCYIPLPQPHLTQKMGKIQHV